MRALTHVLVAEPELPWVPSVVRAMDFPPTEIVADAFTTVTPVTADNSPVEQVPVLVTVTQVLAGVNEPGPLAFENVIVVGAGAGTQPVPGLTSRSAVSVCV